MKRLIAIFLIVLLCLPPAYGAAEKGNKKKATPAQPPVVQGTELDQLRTHMTSNVDEIEGNKWIYEKSTKKLLDARQINKNFFYVYLGQKVKTGFVWPRLYMGFVKEGWVFFKQIIINNDGEIDSIIPPLFKPHHEVLGAGIILEQIDVSANEHETLIKKIIGAKKTMIRFKGDNYAHDFTLSETERTALKRIWRLYELMKEENDK